MGQQLKEQIDLLKGMVKYTVTLKKEILLDGVMILKMLEATNIDDIRITWRGLDTKGIVLEFDWTDKPRKKWATKHDDIKKLCFYYYDIGNYRIDFKSLDDKCFQLAKLIKIYFEQLKGRDDGDEEKESSNKKGEDEEKSDIGIKDVIDIDKELNPLIG